MAPPQLAGDTPVLQVAHPGEIHVFVVLRHELNVAVLHRLDGGLGEALYGHEPLVGQQRLDDIAGAVAVGQGIVDALYLYQQAEGLHVGDDLLACFETIQASVFRGQGGIFIGLRLTFQVEDFRLLEDRCIFGEYVDQQVVLTLADFVVVEVVGRGNLHTARAFLHIGVLVRHDGDAAAYQRQLDELADQGSIARILRVDGHAGIAQQGFRAGGGDHHVILAVVGLDAVGQRVAEVPEAALLLFVFHFQVGNGGVQGRVPVHQALAAIDQLLFMEAHEDFLNRFIEAVVHGEALAAPVDAGAHAAQLSGNVAAGLLLPLPHFIDERFAAEVMAGFAFLGGNFTLHQHLRGDTGVVGAYLPQGVVALHPLPARQGIHDGVLERVAHM